MLVDDDNTSEISDTDSIISTQTGMKSIVEFAAQEQKLSRFAASNQAKKWCRDNFLNNKSLGIALSSRNDMIRLLRNYKDGALWKYLPDGSPTDQSIIPSTEDIQKLIVKGLFLNFSIQTQEYRGYEVLRNDTPTVGIVHPASALAKLADNSNELTVFPRFIVFHTMMTTSRTFLNVITPVNEEWIREESPSFYNNVILDSMAKSRCAKLSIDGLRVNTSRVLLGKFGDKKRELESQLNCSIQYDSTRCVLEAWCTPGDLDKVSHVLTDSIKAAKQLCLDEVEEVVICGSTRAIFGSGGLVRSLLFGDQFVTVNVSGLPMNTDRAELRAFLTKSFGEIRSIEMTYPRGGKLTTDTIGQQKGSAFAKVVFCRPSDAAMAHKMLQGEVWNSHTLHTGVGGFRSTALNAVKSTTQVVMSWATSVSEGKASADFASPEAANSILQLCLATKGFNCPVLQGLGAQVHIRANVTKATAAAAPVYLFPSLAGKPKQASVMYRVNIKGLYPHVDEQDLENAFKQLERMKTSNPDLNQFQPPVRVRVLRAAPKDAIQDEMALSIQTADIRMMIPMQDKLLSMTSFFDSGGTNGRAGFYLQYDSSETTALVKQSWERNIEALQRRNDRILCQESSWMRCGQPIRLQTKYSSFVNMHCALYNYFNAEFDACFRDLSSRLGVNCRVLKPKKEIGRKHAESKTTIHVNAQNAAALDLAIARLQAILSFKVFTPRNNEEKHILFSFTGRKAMVKISDNVTYLHWDNASRIVRVYGPDAATEEAMRKIAVEIKRIAERQQTETFIVSRFKRKELLAAWRELKDPLKDDVMNFVVRGMVLEVQGDADVLVGVRTWLQANKFTSDRQPAPTAITMDMCSLCLCEVEQPSYYYRACDHGGCSSCLTYQFSLLAEITVPATCFSADCGHCHISWPDICASILPDAVDVIKSAAVSKFLRENSKHYRYCPSPGCSQILDLSITTAPRSEREQEALGGTVAFCDQCNVEYCLTCCERDNLPREAHKGDLCADNIVEANAWRIHFQHIADNILTLHCPSCNAAFIDFDGCCAVACGGSGCGKYFCGFCLQAHPNSSVSHSHVQNCPKNPQKGNYFCNQEALNKVHRYAIVGKLRPYLETTVPKGDTKRKLLKNLEPYLTDLGISPQDVI